MDVYDLARAVPQGLMGTAPPHHHGELRRQDLSDKALWWRTGKGRLVRPHRGVYHQVEGGLDLLDRVRAALLVAPASALVGFHTAAQLMGFGVTRTETVHIVVPAGAPFPQRPGITSHTAVLPVAAPAYTLGVPCVPAERCAIDLARTLRRRDALPVLDAALRAGVCTPDSLWAETARHDRLRGVRQVRQLVPLADGRAECRQETQLRLVLHDGGVRGFEPQVRVRDEYGVERYRVDLADPERRVGVEFDGASHLDRARMRADRYRHNWLEMRGWAMRYFTDRDLYHRPDTLVQTVLAAQRRRPTPI